MKSVMDTELRRICCVSIGVGEDGHRYRIKKNLWCIYRGR